MENYHNFDKINNKKSLKIRDFVDFIGASVVDIYNSFSSDMINITHH